MRKMILYIIMLLLSHYACNSDENTIKTSQNNNSINSYFSKKSLEEKKITENIDSFIYEDRKNEIIVFCISFMEALKSKELDSIVDKIEFPLEVECFIQKGKGKVIEMEEFLSYYDSIFDNAFFIKIEEYANSLKKSSLVYDYQLGYDLRNEDFFTLGVNYVKKTDVIHDKYARIFRFEKRKGKYKLILIFCAG